MEGRQVVTSDEERLGTVLAERDDCVIVETGHIFKTKHAIPRDFLHEQEGVLHATVTKHVVSDSPKVDVEETVEITDGGCRRLSTLPRDVCLGAT